MKILLLKIINIDLFSCSLFLISWCGMWLQEAIIHYFLVTIQKMLQMCIFVERAQGIIDNVVSYVHRDAVHGTYSTRSVI